MKPKYKIIFLITALLLFLSLSISMMNYFVSVHNAKEQLKSSSLPLTTDNIYSEIQTHLIAPNIVASMMAQDTFLKDWLVAKDKKHINVKRYLESIKNKYKMHTVFLAAEGSKNYYSSKGLVEKMDEENPNNTWYFEFKNNTPTHEVNIDFNEYIDNEMIMFINHKIYDEEYHLLGITGVGLKLAYVDDMLKHFRKKYKFNVYFADKNGVVVLKEKMQALTQHESMSNEYLVHKKFIPELNLNLIVEAKISDFTSSVIKTFYINILLSLLITGIVIFIIVQMVRKHNTKLENLASHDELTQLTNRRVFDATLKQQIRLYARKKSDVSVLFLDIDNFKKINDTFGHEVGDKVLVRFAEVLGMSVRESDCVARWGGEEFIIAFIDSSFENAQETAEKLRKNIESDLVFKDLLNYNLTASFGLTQIKDNDTVESILTRVDTAMYEAKNTGKNKVVLA